MAFYIMPMHSLTLKLTTMLIYLNLFQATPSFDDFRKCTPRPQLSRLAFDYDKDSKTFLKNVKRPAPMDVDKEPTPDLQSDMASSGYDMLTKNY